jgi:hypothetical protein
MMIVWIRLSPSWEAKISTRYAQSRNNAQFYMPDGVANTAQLVSEGSSKLASVPGEHIVTV